MIVFIDGVNGTGKDHCIRMITREATRMRKPWSLTSIKDVIQNEEHKAELIARNELGFTYDQIDQLYHDHLSLVDHAIELNSKDDRIVIVNRYLPSFYVYQHKLMGGNKNAVPIEKVNDLLNEYKSKLKGIKHIAIHLNSPLDVILERLKKRDGEDNIDVDKITRLHQHYVEYTESIGRFFGETLYTSSNEFTPSVFFDYSKQNLSEIKSH